MTLSLTIFAVIALAFYSSYSEAAKGVRYQVQASPEYKLTWEVKENFVDFIATVKTPGWIGVALNYRPRMNGADMVIGGVDDGKNYLHSYQGFGNTVIPKETSFWKEGSVAFSENGNYTTVSFQRVLNTGEKDVIVVEDLDLYVLWAYGPDDNVRHQHLDNGSIKLNLINPEVSVAKLNLF